MRGRCHCNGEKFAASMQMDLVMNKTRWTLRVVSCLLQAKMAVKNEELIHKYDRHVSIKSR